MKNISEKEIIKQFNSWAHELDSTYANLRRNIERDEFTRKEKQDMVSLVHRNGITDCKLVVSTFNSF